MEKEGAAIFNSPVIQKNTPIKRLGLSRKRKGRAPECSLNPKIQACSGNFPTSFNHEALSRKYITVPQNNDSEVTKSEINYDEEIDLLNKRITAGEEKLKALQSMKDNIVQLEELIEVWRNGCKSAFLHFAELLKERQGENIDFKSVLHRLGIWEVMVENFGSDPELSLMDYSQ